MKSTHTPGPWYVAYRQNYDKSTTADRIVSDDGETICEGLTWNENGEADGALISAAPELLEFAEWAMDQLQGDSGTGESFWEKHPEYNAGKAAVAKARNEPTA